jgi:hypothetical protein
MVIGITMIKIVPGHEKASYDLLRETKGVKEIYHLFGEYDFFLILEAADLTGLFGLLEEVKSDGYILDSWSLLVSRESDRAAHSSIGMAFSSAGELALS